MLLFSHVCFISFVLGTKWHRYSWSPLFHPPWPHFLSFSPEIITILRLGYIILIHVLLFYNIWIYLEHFKIHHKWFYAPHFILQLASPPINGSFLMFTHVDTGSPSLFIFIAVMEENTTVYWPILFFGEHLGSLVLLQTILQGMRSIAFIDSILHWSLWLYSLSGDFAITPSRVCISVWPCDLLWPVQC